MKVLVCGGRDYQDAQSVFKALNSIQRETPIDCVIHGGARGADSLANEWASSSLVKTKCFPADWDLHGKSAGPIRNEQMLLENPDLVVAFPGGKGTAHMVSIAKKSGIKVIEVPGKDKPDGY